MHVLDIDVNNIFCDVLIIRCGDIITLKKLFWTNEIIIILFIELTTTYDICIHHK